MMEMIPNFTQILSGDDMLTEFDIENLVDLLSKLSTDTKVYLGCDSIRFIDKKGTRMARYATVLIVHMNGNKGCKIFSNISYEKDFDIKKSRPKMRLLNEVRKVCELYHQVIPFIDEYEVEVHLDINTDPKHGSNCVAQEAAGYVLGMTGIEPKLKPESWAASFGADGVANGRAKSTHPEWAYAAIL
jgi:predicted RNase H-related nuclease YkuK (DUF458 family)